MHALLDYRVLEVTVKIVKDIGLKNRKAQEQFFYKLELSQATIVFLLFYLDFGHVNHLTTATPTEQYKITKIKFCIVK